jgi:hypothetical protein
VSLQFFEQSLEIAISADGGPRKDYSYEGQNKGLAMAANHHNRFVKKMTEMGSTNLKTISHKHKKDPKNEICHTILGTKNALCVFS